MTTFREIGLPFAQAFDSTQGKSAMTKKDNAK
jgi:hypothetical protein